MGNTNTAQNAIPLRSNAPRQSYDLPRQLQFLRQDPSNTGSLVQCEQKSGDCSICVEPTDTLLCYTSCPVYKGQQQIAKKQRRAANQAELHSACRNCWLTFVCTAINSFAMGRLTCIGCDAALNPAVTLRLLQQHASEQAEAGAATPCGVCGQDCQLMLSRYEEFLLRKCLVRERNMRWCPYGCGYGVIALGFKACPKMQCLRQDCGHDFCFICQRPWVSTGGGGEPSARPLSSEVVEVGHECTVDTTAVMRNTGGLGGLANLFGLNSAIMDAINPQPISATAVQGSRTDMGRSDATNSVGVGHPEGVKRSVSGDEPTATSQAGEANASGRHSRSNSNRSSSSDADTHSPSSGEFLLEGQEAGRVKPCPNCNVLIEKTEDGSCNSVKCSICRQSFCWLCERPLTKLHFFSFSGCTLWGRRRLSICRRVVWWIVVMLLTPVVLPLGLLLLFLFALIAIPIKLLCYTSHEGFSYSVMIITTILSIVVTPIIFVLVAPLVAVAVLIYVYLLLPILLVNSIRQASREDKQVVSRHSPGEARGPDRNIEAGVE